MTPALTTQTAHPPTHPCSPSQRERTKDRPLGGQAQGPGPGLCCLPACLAHVHLRVRHAKARTLRLTLQTPRRPLGPASLTLPGPPRLEPRTNPVGQRGPSEPSPPVGFLHPAWGLWPRPLASLPRLGVQPVSPGRWQPARLGCWSQAKPRVCRVISRGKGGGRPPCLPAAAPGAGRAAPRRDRSLCQLPRDQQNCICGFAGMGFADKPCGLHISAACAWKRPQTRPGASPRASPPRRGGKGSWGGRAAPRCSPTGRPRPGGHASAPRPQGSPVTEPGGEARPGHLCT